MLQIAKLMGSSISAHQNDVKPALPGASAGAAAAGSQATRHYFNKGIKNHAHTPKNV